MTFITQSTPEYFTTGKANISAQDDRRQTQHAISMAMIEAGHEPPAWRPPRPQDQGNLAIAVEGRTDYAGWFGAFLKARELVHERTAHLWLISFYPVETVTKCLDSRDGMSHNEDMTETATNNPATGQKGAVTMTTTTVTTENGKLDTSFAKDGAYRIDCTGCGHVATYRGQQFTAVEAQRHTRWCNGPR